MNALASLTSFSWVSSWFSNGELAWLLALGAGLVAYQLISNRWIDARIEAYFRTRGWTLLDKQHDIDGPWSGFWQIYDVVYQDGEGELRQAMLRTSLLRGVVLSLDEPVRRKPPRPDSERQAARTRILEVSRQVRAQNDEAIQRRIVRQGGDESVDAAGNEPGQ